MRFPNNDENRKAWEYRKVRKFMLFPKTLYSYENDRYETVWLAFADIVQEWQIKYTDCGTIKYWEDAHWYDEIYKLTPYEEIFKLKRYKE